MTATDPHEMTPEAFLALPSDADEDYDTEQTPGATPPMPGDATAVVVLPENPLEAIAASLQAIVDNVRVSLEPRPTVPLEEYEDLSREHRELEALHDTKQQLIEDALALIKPSTSKLANSLRELLEPVVVPASAEADSSEQPSDLPDELPVPADDAPIEEWIAFARARGLVIDEGRTNRSQIRTALGLPHPSASS